MNRYQKFEQDTTASGVTTWHKKEEKQFRVPSFGLEVFAVTLMAGVFAGLAALGIAVQDEQGVRFMWPFTVMGAVGLITLILSFWVYLDQVNRIKEAKQSQRPRQPIIVREPEPREIPVTVMGQDSDPLQVVRPDKTLPAGAKDRDPGSVTLSGRQVDRLLSWYEDDNINTIRRDPTDQLPGLRDLGLNSEAVTLIRLMGEAGYAEKRGKQTFITYAGYQWLKQE